MLESTARYATASRTFMAEALQYLALNDLPQASEKGWGAAAQMVKAIAEERGWQHDTHRRLYGIIGALAGETGDRQFSRLFQIASDLHINFYENWLPAQTVSESLQDVGELLTQLGPLAETG